MIATGFPAIGPLDGPLDRPKNEAGDYRGGP
jgi:hypothetical protein